MINRNYIRPMFSAIAVTALIGVFAPTADARTQLKNICHVKGQEENTLRGYGLVVGLSGTGEAGDGPTMRALAESMQNLGMPLPTDGKSGSGVDELKKLKNAALVLVTATVPGTGARRGDQVDCLVSAINGKSLSGGQLAFAALKGPNVSDTRVYALCQGQIRIENTEVPTVGVIHDGCQMEADLYTPFYKDGYITLILDSNHANFQTADAIADAINSQVRESLNYSKESAATRDVDICQAIDAANIKVRIPDSYRNDPVKFASDILDTKLYENEPEARVVINSRAGSIVISGEVEIGDVVVSHKNIVIEATAAPRFAAVDVDQANQPKLKQLVDQLNSLKVPTQDMIEIIKGIDRDGKLHGRLIIQ
ncbi:MAG TPA: flagellar basal body P-ring protein FlgI [Lacipirellulaceae bacterium]